MGLDRFGPGLRVVVRLLLVLLCVEVVRLVVALVDTWRTWQLGEHAIDAYVEDVATLTDAEVGEAAPWATAARPLDDIRSALDLFERNYRDHVERPALRWGEQFGDGRPSVEFVEQPGERLDPDQWRRDRRRRDSPPL